MSDEILGTIELGHSTRLIFTVSRWNGQQYASVRKHVASEKYSGPTKSGLTMLGDVAVSVIEALGRLNGEVPGPTQREFARIAKRGDAQIVISVIPPDDLKSLPSV